MSSSSKEVTIERRMKEPLVEELRTALGEESFVKMYDSARPSIPKAAAVDSLVAEGYLKFYIPNGRRMFLVLGRPGTNFAGASRWFHGV